MFDRSTRSRALAAGTMILGLGASAAIAFPDEKPKEQGGGELGALLEKLPPDVRERLIAEIERVRVEAEKLKAEAMERGEKLKQDAMEKVEEVKRDAQARLERAEVELRRQMESVERARQEAGKDQRAAAEKMREVAEKARQSAETARARVEERVAVQVVPHEKHGEHGDHAHEADHAKKATAEMRVEIRKEGDGQPLVKVYRDGKLVEQGDVPGELLLKLERQGEPDIAKLPPEKRAEIEKARAELKAAQERLQIAAEKLAQLEGGKRGNVMVFRGQGMPPINVRPFMGDRVPGTPLPPGAMGRTDRLPRPPVIPVPPQPPAPPELENRISKAEKALDDILKELKKIQESKEEDDDDEEAEETRDVKGKKKLNR